MKMLLCADALLAAMCAEDMDTGLMHKWQAARLDRLNELLSRAAQSGAAYVTLYGSLFGAGMVPERAIDRLFDAVLSENALTVIAVTGKEELKRVSYRRDIPENLIFVDSESGDSVRAGEITVSVKDGAVVLELSANDSLQMYTAPDGRRVIEEQPIPGFEPLGFEDALKGEFGCGVLEWTEEGLAGYSVLPGSAYAYKALEVCVNPGESGDEITEKICAAATDCGKNAFLRVTLTGVTSFGLIPDTDAIRQSLEQTVFCAAVYDNTSMDIDGKSLAADISLRSEFVRLALKDDSLSETERSRLISCGWNALSGKEVSAK